MNEFPNYNQQDATLFDLSISTDAVHVSGGSSAHHQEHIRVYTASGIVNQYCCWLVAWMRWNAKQAKKHINTETSKTNCTKQMQQYDITKHVEKYS